MMRVDARARIEHGGSTTADYVGMITRLSRQPLPIPIATSLVASSETSHLFSGKAGCHKAFITKLSKLSLCLHRIRKVAAGDASRVRDVDVQDIEVLNLQRAIQAAIDLAAHTIAANDWGLPDTLRKHFTILEQERVIPSDLARRLEEMTGFRKIAIRDYEAIDTGILESIVSDRLGDIEEFADHIRRRETGD